MFSNAKLTMALLQYYGSILPQQALELGFASFAANFHVPISLLSSTELGTWNRLPVHSPNPLLHILFAYTVFSGI